MEVDSLVKGLLQRGDFVAIDNGRLKLEPASDRPIPSEWLMNNKTELVTQILDQTGTDALEYMNYSTGSYGQHHADGVTLQFVNSRTAESAYVIFNADLTRARSSKNGNAGTVLPPGQFRVSKGSYFYKFWHSTDLNMPPRLSQFHDYMGNLKGLLFKSYYVKDERLDAGQLRPISITHKEILSAFNLPYTIQTTAIHHPDISHTNQSYKETAENQCGQHYEPDLSAGDINYGKKDVREYGYTVSTIPISLNGKKTPHQTNKEWLEAYDKEN